MSEDNAHEVADRLSQLMIDAGKDLIVPLKCDATIADRWSDL